MDYSAANTGLWNVIIQFGLIAGSILIANGLRNKISFIRRSLMPIPVIGGFLLLILKYAGVVTIDDSIMETLVYHGIALGFIAMSLRTVAKNDNASGDLVGLKSGAIIVSTYLIQAIAGLIITIFLAYTFIPGMFRAAGLLLPMGFGQGPGQANNVGTSYEALGFAGGRSFGLSIAAAGYIVACVVGVIILNYLARKNLIRKSSGTKSEDMTIGFYQDKNEIPVSDSIDKFSIQISMVIIVYLITFLAAWGITSGLSAISEGLAKTLNSLIWGFNFIIGAAIAMLVRVLMNAAMKKGIIERQYQNNYLLNRISGFFFDIMIVAGIASINLADLEGLWVPFILLVAAGAVVTWIHLSFVCKKVYKNYYYEGLISMYGMLTGTISSGVLLLREVDPDLATPAANNLVIGSSFGIILGAPVLVLVSLAPKSNLMCWVTMALAAVYYLVLMLLIHKAKKKAK